MAATLGYSSFFSSGLLAPKVPASQPSRSSSPTTPRAATATLPQDDVTPTAPTRTHENVPDESQVLPSISIPSADDSRPRLRRRRSSLAGATSPLTAMKTSGPIRAATASVQRSLRARAGSDASVISTTSIGSLSLHESAPVVAKGASKPAGIVGRLRSGSLGTALRSRRGLRRVVPPVPALPPPTSPLPAVPPIPALSHSLSTVFGSPVMPAASRPPLMRRAQTSDNYELTATAFSIGGVSPMCLVEGEDEFPIGKRVVHEMQVDYPSPVDGSSPFDWKK
ncbi:hypothetical protein LXA43DRAFT_913738 [Ganoderma leucocontextum]|nr:hypothetical protein LXA43DRAFT_913738 [Ganoderma leucocontextum]